jgi:hypothetical protein
MPYSDLQYQFLITEPSWGREGSDSFKSKLNKSEGEPFFICMSCQTSFLSHPGVCLNCKGQDIRLAIKKQSTWESLNWLVRDMRLGNLTKKQEDYCVYFAQAANACLNFKPQSLSLAFAAAVSKIAVVLELSQSRNSNFRKLGNTVTSENIYSGDLEPKKKGLFTNSKKMEV